MPPRPRSSLNKARANGCPRIASRAEVYQELVHAEQDGQLATLNRTVYAHH
jgi:hypothetical protein